MKKLLTRLLTTHYSLQTRKAFSLIEIILTVGLFVIFSSGALFVILQGLDSNRLGTEEAVATQFATEGLEAVRSIKNQSFTNLTNGNKGIIRNAQGVWEFNGTNNAYDKYARVITIADVYRDGSGNIVTAGTLDPNSKKAASLVTWNLSSARTNEIELATYLTNWQAPIPRRGGILVYGDGGSTSDLISFKILDGENGIWNTAAPTADIDPTTNRALRVARVFASSTRNEKILISKHFNGTTQYIYAQVYDGTSWNPANKVLLSSWNASTFLEVKNFDGTYLQNGDFMVVYSDNTNVPKFALWDGTNWTTGIATRNIGRQPNYIVTRSRPGTNEVMAAFFDQNRDTNTQYFDGGSYITANWTLHSEHSSSAPLSNNRELIDFVWSLNNNLIGGLLYANRNSDRALTMKIWTANGSGGGNWSNNANAQNQGRLGAMALISRPGVDEFLACDKDNNNDIYCFESNSTPSWTTPQNNVLTLTTHTGDQRSFDLGFEPMTGNTALAVYSDLTNVPKLKKYNTGTNIWDANATSLNTLSNTLTTVTLVPQAGSDDIIILLADGNRRLYTLVWDGNSDAAYTTPAGMAFSTHGTNGSDPTEFWYDFTWDRY